MNRNAAANIITAAIEAIDDDQLPKPDGIEERDGRTIAWFGGTGYHLGSTRDGFGEHIPGGSHRNTAVWEALVHEALYRLDLAHPRVETYKEQSARAEVSA